MKISKHFLVMVIIASGCASTSPKPALKDASKKVYARSGYKLYWNQGGKVDKEVDKRVASLLARPLFVEEAVQIGLLRNPSLQATYEEVSIAQADLVQAGLLKNPVLSGSIHFPLTSDAQTDMTGDIVQDFLELFMIPARKKIARTRLEAVKNKVGDAMISFAHDVKKAYYAVQAAQQLFAMRKAVLDAAEAAYILAQRQHDAGNINDLELAQQQSLYEQIALDTLRSEGELLEHREALTRAMGVWGKETTWQVENKLSELPTVEVPLQHVESVAIAQRLDLAGARNEMQSIAYALGLAKNFRYLGGANVGVTYERTFAGSTVMGPGAALELPIFDQRQAVIARLEALFRQSHARETELAINIRSEVRSARNRIVYARKLVERYAQVLVPLRERVVKLSQEQYNAMLIGVFQLLIAKQNEVNVYREFIEALRDYWTARADLERAAGGRLTLMARPKKVEKKQ